MTQGANFGGVDPSYTWLGPPPIHRAPCSVYPNGNAIRRVSAGMVMEGGARDNTARGAG